MGLFLRPRRPLLRLAAGAATAGIADKAGQRRAGQDAYNQQGVEAYEAAQAPPPAYAPVPAQAPAPAAGPPPDSIAELDRLAGLHESGALTDEEFTAALRGVLVAEFEGDRIGSFRQYWNEVELIDGLGLLPARPIGRRGAAPTGWR
jgi:hypothetical protein